MAICLVLSFNVLVQSHFSSYRFLMHPETNMKYKIRHTKKSAQMKQKIKQKQAELRQTTSFAYESKKAKSVSSVSLRRGIGSNTVTATKSTEKRKLYKSKSTKTASAVTFKRSSTRSLESLNQPMPKSKPLNKTTKRKFNKENALPEHKEENKVKKLSYKMTLNDSGQSLQEKSHVSCERNKTDTLRRSVPGPSVEKDTCDNAPKGKAAERCYTENKVKKVFEKKDLRKSNSRQNERGKGSTRCERPKATTFKTKGIVNVRTSKEYVSNDSNYDSKVKKDYDKKEPLKKSSGQNVPGESKDRYERPKTATWRSNIPLAVSRTKAKVAAGKEFDKENASGEHLNKKKVNMEPKKKEPLKFASERNIPEKYHVTRERPTTATLRRHVPEPPSQPNAIIDDKTNSQNVVSGTTTIRDVVETAHSKMNASHESQRHAGKLQKATVLYVSVAADNNGSPMCGVRGSRERHRTNGCRNWNATPRRDENERAPPDLNLKRHKTPYTKTSPSTTRPVSVESCKNERIHDKARAMQTTNNVLTQDKTSPLPMTSDRTQRATDKRVKRSCTAEYAESCSVRSNRHLPVPERCQHSKTKGVDCFLDIILQMDDMSEVDKNSLQSDTESKHMQQKKRCHSPTSNSSLTTETSNISLTPVTALEYM